MTLLAAVALLAGCQPGAGPGYTLDGVLTGGEAPTGKVYLQRQMPDGQMVSTDSAAITDGKFSLKGHVDRPQMYTLRIDLRTDPTESVQGKVFASNFYLENSPITFEGNLKTLPGVFYDPERPLEAPVIKGSATEDFYARFRADIKPVSDSLAVIDRRYWEEYTAPMMNDKEHKHDYTEVGVALVKEEARWRKELQEKTLAFIRENPSSVVAFDQLVALFSDFTVNYSGKQIDEMRSWVADAWTGTPQLAALDSIVSRIKPVALGEKYADIALNDTAMAQDALQIKLAVMQSQLKTHEDTLNYVNKLKDIYAKDESNDMIFSTICSMYISINDRASLNALVEGKLAKDPNNFTALAMHGQSCMNDHKWDDAIAVLTKASGLQPTNVAVVASIGNCYMYKAQEAAEKATANGKRLSPDAEKVIIDVYMQAISYLEKAKDMDKTMEFKNVWAYSLYTCCYRALGPDDAKTKEAEMLTK